MQAKGLKILKVNTPRFFLWFVLLFLRTSLWSQVNVQVGYGISSLQSDANQRIFDQFKAENPWLVSGSKDLGLLHGLDLGLRYGMSQVLTGIQWKNRLSSWTFDGVSPTTQSSFKHEFFYNLSAFSFFLEAGRSFLGFGASLDYNDFTIKERQTGFDSKIAIFSQNFWSNRFYVNLNFPAGSTAQVTLQCYYDMPWGNVDLGELGENVLHQDKPKELSDPLRHFGISLIINNGPQGD